MIKRALIHVDNTEGILEFADYLASSGWKILSANKTEELLQKQKIPVVHENTLVSADMYISETSRLIRNILLTQYDSDTSEDQENDENNIFIICMNVVPLFSVANSSNSFDSNVCPSNFFISSILRSAFSNYENLLILTDPADYKEAIIQLKTGEITKKFRLYLAAKALNLISSFDGGIASSILQSQTYDSPFLKYLTYPFKKDVQLAKGTNKQQTAYLYKLATNNSALSNFHRINGKELSFSELSDCFYAWEQINTLYTILKNQFKVKSTNADGYDFTTQFTPLTGTVFTIAVKFNSIVGAALSTNTVDSLKKTCLYDYDCTDDVVFACSAVIDADAAKELINYKVAAIVAPSFTNDAKEVFAQNKKIKLITSGKVENFKYDAKLVGGGIIMQNNDATLFDSWKVKTKNRPSQIITDEMAFGMLLAMKARSYSAVLLKDNAIVGISQGCTSTFKAVEGAYYESYMHAKRINAPEGEPFGDVLISDAEIEFNDTIKKFIDSGIKAIIQTGGTPTDNEFINYCDEKGIVMVFTEKTHISF